MTSLFNAIEIEINHNCNKACSYCPNAEYERIEKGHMSPLIFKLLIQQLNDIQFSGRMSFSFYNEPTLSPNLELFTKLAKVSLPKITIELYSNGTLINTVKFRSLIAAGIDKFIITKHENIIDYVFEQTMNELTAEELKKVEYRTYQDLTLTNRGGLLKQITHDKDLTLLPCMIPKMMATVTVEGNVVPCFEDFYQKNQVGNITEKHIRDIWHSGPYAQFRENLARGLRHKYEVCKSCNRTQVLF